MMSMKFSQLRTHWNPDDAHLIISFLNELRDTRWATYGNEIIEQQQKEAQQKIDQQSLLDIDESINF